ncbi:MAG TPA: HNH endonuclease signature motif containing protein [Acidimicrobiales bacterium]|nr:HNH endonuclease signature motif containing protein [Acidimicrobiales bacterium]
MTVWSAVEAPRGEVEPDGAVLADAVASELAVDVHELSAEQLGARSLRLRAGIDALSVAVARTDAAFESSRGFRALDPSCTKASQWLIKQTGIPIKQAREAYRRARRLALLPALQAAVVVGAVTFWHACTIARLASSPARTRRLRIDVDLLVEAAHDLAARDFRLRLRAWSEEHFTSEVEAEASVAEADRSVAVGRSEAGQPTVHARLHPVFGTAVLNGLARIERELFDADWAAAKGVHGSKTRLEHLRRTAGQRRADALVEMAMRAEAATPGASARRPLVTLLVGFDQARSRVAEIEDGTHLTTDQALRAMTVADLERAVLGPDDRVSIGRRARLFKGAERRAVEIRDRVCTTDGCEVAPDRCEVDHVRRFEDRGETVQANGRLRCVEHHDGRRAAPETRPQPWEYAEDVWDAIEAERVSPAEPLRRSA